MSSSSIITSLALIGQQITIYCGISLLIAGTLGGFILTIVFLSLQVFRQSSCAFYLTIMSIVNIGQLLTGLLTRIMITGFSIDWTTTSLFYCKFRLYFAILCAQISLTCLCLAIIDQYFATSAHPRWQQWSNIKIAHRLTILFIIIWVLCDIPYLTSFNQIYSTTTNKTSCVSTNTIFTQYRIYFIAPVAIGFLPVCIASIFAIMAYLNVQRIAYRTVPLVRRELDKQLTSIVLVQIPCTIISIVPYAVTNILISNQNLMANQVTWAQIQFASSVTILLFYSGYSTPFYVCILVSERFRRQLMFVLTKIFCHRWSRRNEVAAAQIALEA
ncbi:unnamed protein product [Adineta steineri]|uniref:G-protein coupled receptors family 1 profile domain-containing protein n=1 Tax=Adineta steineri TaxID=433720 RepID=A0A818QT52_9BILA|nr:unnamed protein product [Adineta steineri]CAF3641576.1 unnamed protein product [Adineta steineri]CAF3680329.1 unnamed protein product [Adineta steineri]